MTPMIYVGLPHVEKLNYINRLHEVISETVAEYFNVSINSLKSASRLHEYVEARMILIYLLKTHTQMSFMGIGRYLNRHHATIMYNFQRCKELIEIDSKFRNTVLQIEELITKQSEV